MFQVIKCECGESSMLDGRCIGCKRVRPSAEEIFEQIDKAYEDLEKLRKELEVAFILERDDARKSSK